MRSLTTHLTAGIDVGSSTIKVAVMRSRAGDDGVLLGESVQRIRRRELRDVAHAALDEACTMADVRPADFDYLATTGDADAVEHRTGHFYSMTTHARGGLFLVPEARAVLDIGGLHARAIRMDERGKVLGQRMTSQCASGSGQFLENISRYLGVALADVGALSLSAQSPEEVSGICAVLAETDVINMVSRGLSTADILKGIHVSIAGRLVGLLRAAGIDGIVAATGGLAADRGLIATLRERVAEGLGRRGKSAHIELRTNDRAILAGAIGAALLGARRRAQLTNREQATQPAA
jgi:benzoyl-CoA reductase subunit D